MKKHWIQIIKVSSLNELSLTVSSLLTLIIREVQCLQPQSDTRVLEEREEKALGDHLSIPLAKGTSYEERRMKRLVRNTSFV